MTENALAAAGATVQGEGVTITGVLVHDANASLEVRVGDCVRMAIDRSDVTDCAALVRAVWPQPEGEPHLNLVFLTLEGNALEVGGVRHQSRGERPYWYRTA